MKEGYRRGGVGGACLFRPYTPPTLLFVYGRVCTSLEGGPGKLGEERRSPDPQARLHPNLTPLRCGLKQRGIALSALLRQAPLDRGYRQKRRGQAVGMQDIDGLAPSYAPWQPLCTMAAP